MKSILKYIQHKSQTISLNALGQISLGESLESPACSSLQVILETLHLLKIPDILPIACTNPDCCLPQKPSHVLPSLPSLIMPCPEEKRRLPH